MESYKYTVVDEAGNANRYRVVDMQAKSSYDMLEEAIDILRKHDVEEGDTVILKYTIMNEFSIEQAYTYSYKFRQDFEEKCLRNLIPLYVMFALEFIIHQKH